MHFFWLTKKNIENKHINCMTPLNSRTREGKKTVGLKEHYFRPLFERVQPRYIDQYIRKKVGNKEHKRAGQKDF